MPVFWFALSFAPRIHWGGVGMLFFILHGLVYPASNAYNSYMDRDTSAIGGVARPKAPTRQLFQISIAFDLLAIVLSLFISLPVAFGIAVYISFSRLYSYRGIRLKRFAVLGYITVILNQGGLVFALVYSAASGEFPWQVPQVPMIAAAFLIGGFYPITQVYQHQADAADGVKTISMLLGIRGTFIFCALMYTAAFGLLFYEYHEQGRIMDFLVLQLFFIPVIFFFLRWLFNVWHRSTEANFKQTMRMNWLAATCTNLAFITLIIKQFLG